MMLFEVADWSAPAALTELSVHFSSEITFGYDKLPSTLIIRGGGWPGERNAFRKKRLAAPASRSGLSRKVDCSACGIHRAGTDRPICPPAEYRCRQLATNHSSSGVPRGSGGSVRERTAG